MKVASSKARKTTAPDPAIAELLGEVSTANLRGFVERFAFPRHFFAENRANRRARDMLIELATRFGYKPQLQGDYDNVVLTSPGPEREVGPFILLGAHYDSQPGTPGADDNASAMAVCLECARLIQASAIGPVMIVFFNREEDGLIGSTEFVAHLGGSRVSIAEAHVFEMVGYTDRTKGSQRLPVKLPVVAPDVGDFLALIANSGSNDIAEALLQIAASYIPEFSVLALKTYFGSEKLFRDLSRSDHAPFWAAGIPALMWTDTSEFRNPNYHEPSDTPDTLDYDFMRQVTQLALARAALYRKQR